MKLKTWLSVNPLNMAEEVLSLTTASTTNNTNTNTSNFSLRK